MLAVAHSVGIALGIAVWIIGFGIAVCIVLGLLASRRLWRIYPLPSELERLSDDERREITRSFSEGRADLDPALARLWSDYVISTAPLQRRLHLTYLAAFALIFVLTLLGLIVKPVNAVVPALFFGGVAVFFYRKLRQFERHVAQVEENAR
jgi:hypothetical protein